MAEEMTMRSVSSSVQIAARGDHWESHKSLAFDLTSHLLPLSNRTALAPMFFEEAARAVFQPPTLALIFTLLLSTIFIFRLVSSWARRSQFADFAASQCCAPASAIPRAFLGAFRHKLSLLMQPGGDLLDVVFANKFRKYGSTYALHDRNGMPVVIHTIDPENVNTILNKSADHWGPSKARSRTMYPLAQQGLLNSEGATWHKNRKMILRHIFTKRAKDVRYSESDIRLLFEAIGAANANGWTEEVDLLDLLHRLSLDMSTTFLLGTSADSQIAGMRDARMKAAMAEFSLVPGERSSDLSYSEAYEIVRNYFSWRSKLGSKYWIADGFKYRKACHTLNAFADDLIERAIERANEGEIDGDEGRFGLIQSLVKEIGDPIQIRNLIMDLFIAGQNMTGTMAAWIFAQLEAHQPIFRDVRNEIVDKFGTEDQPRAALTWNNLKSCTKLQNVILETLRMYPLLANVGRDAKTDTVLPRGGGDDGSLPLAVPKGAAVTCNIYLTHRRQEEWGDDAWEFIPDRWTGRKFGPEYAPFGMGPRICIGQHLAVTEISYLVARILQHFDEMKSPEGRDNLTKGYRVVVAPKNGVKVRLRKAGYGSHETMIGAKATSE